MTPPPPPDLNARARKRLTVSNTAAPQARPPAAGKANGERWAILNGMVDRALRDLGGAEVRVWLVLYRDERGGTARTGMSDIARRAGLTRRGVVKAVAALKARGIIEVSERGTIDGKPNTYRLKMPT